MTQLQTSVLAAACCLTCCEGILADTFTYQATVFQTGQPLDDTCDFRFLLFDAESNGAQVGSTISFDDVFVQQGRVTLDCDFGESAFDGSPRWLEIELRSPSGVGGYSSLSPRQPVHPTPYALYAHRLGAGGLGTSYSEPVALTNPLNALSGNGLNITKLNADNIASGMLSSSHMPTAGIWSLGGALQVNGGLVYIDPGANRVGVGTNAPSSALDVIGPADSTALRGTGFVGVLGEASNWGLGAPTGVKGVSNHVSGLGFGVWGIEKTGSAIVTFTPAGVYGESPNNAGVLGHSDSGDGMRGESIGGTGVFGESETGHGVRGQSSGGAGAGVRGDGIVGIGVYGTSDIGNGIRGDSQFGTGVRGFGSSYGMHGSAVTGTGVAGESDGTTGMGLYGASLSPTGINYGVYGLSSSASGFDFYAAGPGLDYGTNSSRRWKRNVVNIDDPLYKLSKLRGVYYDWDEEHGGHHDIGMIAEEVGAVLPESVRYEENGVDAIGMDYSKLTPLLVEAFNALRVEHEATMDSQAERIVALEAENGELRDRLAILEAMLESR